MSFLFTFNRLKPDQITILKPCLKKLNLVTILSYLVTPCFTNSYFSGQYFNHKIILEILNKYYEAKKFH